MYWHLLYLKLCFQIKTKLWHFYRKKFIVKSKHIIDVVKNSIVTMTMYDFNFSLSVPTSLTPVLLCRRHMLTTRMLLLLLFFLYMLIIVELLLRRESKRFMNAINMIFNYLICVCVYFKKSLSTALTEWTIYKSVVCVEILWHFNNWKWLKKDTFKMSLQKTRV